MAETKSIEQELKAAGAIRLPLSAEMAEIEAQLKAYDADQSADPRVAAQKAEEKRFRLITLKLQEDLQKLSRQVEFRRVCWKILELAGVFKLSYVAGDTHETALREGRRSVGNDLLALLHSVDPGLFVQMQKESYSDARSREKQNAG